VLLETNLELDYSKRFVLAEKLREIATGDMKVPESFVGM
jgi:hypothetical protein